MSFLSVTLFTALQRHNVEYNQELQQHLETYTAHLPTCEWYYLSILHLPTYPGTPGKFSPPILPWSLPKSHLIQHTTSKSYETWWTTPSTFPRLIVLAILVRATYPLWPSHHHQHCMESDLELQLGSLDPFCYLASIRDSTSMVPWCHPGTI